MNIIIYCHGEENNGLLILFSWSQSKIFEFAKKIIASGVDIHSTLTIGGNLTAYDELIIANSPLSPKEVNFELIDYLEELGCKPSECLFCDFLETRDVSPYFAKKLVIDHKCKICKYCLMNSVGCTQAHIARMMVFFSVGKPTLDQKIYDPNDLNNHNEYDREYGETTIYENMIQNCNGSYIPDTEEEKEIQKEMYEYIQICKNNSDFAINYIQSNPQYYTRDYEFTK